MSHIRTVASNDAEKRFSPATCEMIDSGGGTTRAEDAQGTPTQSHIPPSILVYEDAEKRFSPATCEITVL